MRLSCSFYMSQLNPSLLQAQRVPRTESKETPKPVRLAVTSVKVNKPQISIA